MSTISTSKWISLTRTVNKILAPNRFLQKLLWSFHETLGTEDIEIGTILAGRDMAPLIRKNGEAVIVGGTTTKFATVSGPNIRIKQPQTPSRGLFDRQPGTQIHLAPGESGLSEMQKKRARDLEYMNNMVVNATEYMCSQILAGALSYVVEDQEVIQITVPRSAGNTITLTTFWDNGAGAANASARPFQNIHAVKKVMADAEGLAPTDAICGDTAATILLDLHESGSIKLMTFQTTAPTAGMVEFTNQFTEDGVIFLGTLAGVRFWSYTRSLNVAGVATKLIRDKYIEFVNTSQSSERVLYYAAIPDEDAIQQGLVMTEKFAKSWVTPDPSVRWNLIHSRPLPWSRKPDSTVSVKVISG